MKALVTGIKPYFSRLSQPWTDHLGPRFSAFEPISTKKQVVDATRFNGNTGNYFVGEAAVEAVGRSKATFVNFGALHAKTKNADYLSKINTEFDCVVLVTANLLRSDYDAALEAELLSRLDLPIVVLGIGCQRKRDLPKDIPAGTLRLLEVLNSREHHIFARGSETASYLISQGLKQVWPTGCPSMYLRPENIAIALRRLKTVEWSENLRVAFSGYIGRDPAAVGDIAVFGNHQRDFDYVLQDEHMFYGLELSGADEAIIYNDLSGEITGPCSFRGSAAVPDVRKRIFFNTHQWRGVMSTHDFSFGRRFHGVMAALQVGVPGLMVAVDDRMREMLDQLQLPYIDLPVWNAAADKSQLIKETIAKFDVDQFCERHYEAAELFRQRMSAIGLG